MPYQFELTPAIVRYLQIIERVKETVRLTILPLASTENLRFSAQLRATHYSTIIEGNRLTLKETEKVVQHGQKFPGRERDVQEVERYYQALQQMEKWVDGKQAITETRIRKLHAILYSGRSAKPSAYRDGPTVIRDEDGGIVYMPPEAKDVPSLMKQLANWIEIAKKDMPIPVVAGIAHYQFETIHPFFDGNGRTGRMLTTWILYQGNYDLGRFYALEEFYAQDLRLYYEALVTHPNHNYYFGRNEAVITPWLDYFLQGMAIVFERVSEQVRDEINDEKIDQEAMALLRALDYRARRVLGLFSTQEFITSSDAANLLGISVRHTRDLISGWVKDGWIEIENPSKRGRKYRLAAGYQKLIGQ
ncbi:MAG: Fic family protein [Chloroflexota bacterium]